MSHPSHDDLAAYALGALEAREERSIGKHVAGCERCAAEMRERLAPAVGVLAESVEQMEPPPEPAAEPDGHGPRARRPPRRPAKRGARLAPAALGLRRFPAAARRRARRAGAGDRRRRRLPDRRRPGRGGGDRSDRRRLRRRRRAAGARGRTRRPCTMHGMDQLAKGSVYQVWVDRAGAMQPSATFLPHEDGTATAALPEAADDVDGGDGDRGGRPRPHRADLAADHRRSPRLAGSALG